MLGYIIAGSDVQAVTLSFLLHRYSDLAMQKNL